MAGPRFGTDLPGLSVLVLLCMFYLELLSSKSQSCSTNGKNGPRTALKLIYLMNKPKKELISPHQFFVTDEVEADFRVLRELKIRRELKIHLFLYTFISFTLSIVSYKRENKRRAIPAALPAYARA